MSALVAAFAAGVLFGLGLSVSEMVNPERVIGFLDVAGSWDPTLLFAMAGALLVTATAFPVVLRRRAPVLTDRFQLPTKTTIDRPLLLGAVIFGVGWGLAGFCPGPAVAALATGSPAVITFVAAMAAGQWIIALTER